MPRKNKKSKTRKKVSNRKTKRKVKKVSNRKTKRKVKKVSNRKTKRKFYPNLQTKKFYVPETGEWVILKVSANALRTINKNGIASVLSKAIANGNILV